MNKKKVLYLSLVVIMVAILSFSSLAWFTADDKAVNDFTVSGAGEDDPDQIFSVDIKEDVDGKSEPVDDMTFEDVLPGDQWKKEAYITNTGSYEQYIRVVLTVTDWDLIKDIVSINMDDAFADYWHIDAGAELDADGNLTNGVVDNDGNLVVTLYLDKKLGVDETVNIMDYVSISTDADQEDFIADGFKDGFQITMKADAAQTKNVIDTYDAAEWKNAKATFETLAI